MQLHLKDLETLGFENCYRLSGSGRLTQVPTLKIPIWMQQNTLGNGSQRCNLDLNQFNCSRMQSRSRQSKRDPVQSRGKHLFKFEIQKEFKNRLDKLKGNPKEIQIE